MAWMNSPENARLALPSPQELASAHECCFACPLRLLDEGHASVKRRSAVYHLVLMVRTLACVRATFLSACTAACLVACASTTPFEPTYSQAELKGLCERHGGCWHPDDSAGGYCEFKL
jgi:hypothetical protein